jgi:hypothetical protein
MRSVLRRALHVWAFRSSRPAVLVSIQRKKSEGNTRFRSLLSCAALLAAACRTLAGQQADDNRSNSGIQTIYLIPSSLWDLGFKLPPQEQLDDIRPHLGAVIRTAQQDPQFRWVIESAWQQGFFSTKRTTV